VKAAVPSTLKNMAVQDETIEQVSSSDPSDNQFLDNE
tara:strand:+ start:394 stop:504 length:111 start_codon:yes stop_codon:yes gene_type:complete